jgi:flagellar hook assembly protein FlgD
LAIYNIIGQRVRTLVDEYQTAGYKTVHWDGTDEAGRQLASGIYFYRIQAGEFTDVKTMILMK